MTETELRQLVDQVRCGDVPRRQAIQRLLGLGLSLPMAGLMLMEAGVRAGAAAFTYKPTRRGGGGICACWNGRRRRRSIRTSRPASRTPSRRASSTSRWRSGTPTATCSRCSPPRFPAATTAGSRPTAAVSSGSSRRGVTWHDGQPFTADDVVFNWQYAIDPAAATVTAGSYRNLKIEKIDSHTVRVVFSAPSPFWPGQYSQVMLVPKHLFAPFSGAKSRDAPNNNKPVGTGAYTFVDFKPGDLLHAALNPNYHQANRPHFDTLELKGGGDASVGRACRTADR